jgi:hypothetical protein
MKLSVTMNPLSKIKKAEFTFKNKRARPAGQSPLGKGHPLKSNTANISITLDVLQFPMG